MTMATLVATLTKMLATLTLQQVQSPHEGWHVNPLQFHARSVSHQLGLLRQQVQLLHLRISMAMPELDPLATSAGSLSLCLLHS